MLIKICGLMRPEDAAAADLAGADLLGLIFAPSPRRLTEDQAERLILAVGKPEKFVAVFADEAPEVMTALAVRLRLGWIQLHGRENVKTAQKIRDQGLRVIKTFSIGKSSRKAVETDYPADYYLFDTRFKAFKGGTGKTFDWTILKDACVRRPYFLSGGLSSENIAEAVRLLRPAGVDASSRLETVPGVKDPERIRKFIEQARTA